MNYFDLQVQLEYRSTLAFSQAVTAAVHTLLNDVHQALADKAPERIGLWFQIGYLLQMQSLLSTQGAEISMLQDMNYAMDELTKTSVMFHPRSEKGAWRVAREKSGRVVIHVPLDDLHDSQLSTLKGSEHSTRFGGCCITFVPSLFTLGVNEMQTIANAIPGVGEPELQSEINQAGLKQLKQYWERFEQVEPPVPRVAWIELAQSFTVVGSQDERVDLSQPPSVWESLERLLEDASSGSDKDVQLLIDSFMLCSAMHGGRMVCCKSAKDRTSMSSTLEMAVLMANKGLFGYEVYTYSRAILQLIRKLRGPEGCRIRNCELNTGKKMYAFNVFQQSTLPDLLKPPPSCAGNCVS
eukprot:TRINITY_DN29222_c0_g2_i2.p1 TRINITY_DN29222_c0_g2~~TRINITY_DN29222_c0_g2_i2.p1  ORF type:complete len:353 (-),score=86.62 TRINITY_DN29222_c0_g2_i2:406-1464(-)